VTVTHDHGVVAARRAVLTVPVGVWNDLDVTPPMNPAKRAVSAENHAGQGQKLWVLAHGVPADLCAFGWRTRLDHLGAMYETDRGTVLVGFAPGSSRVDVGDLDDVRTAVRELAPEAEVLEVVSHDWVGDPCSRGTWATYRPGQVTAYEREVGRPEGRLHLAGSLTGTRWRGFVDGAVESGLRVATEVVVALTGA
jgi:monoamine oxidase